MKLSTQTSRSRTFLKIKLACQFSLLYVLLVISCKLQYICQQKKKCVDTLCYTCWNTRADCFGVLFGFQQLLFFSRTFRYVNWGRFAQFRPLSLSGPAPLWYVIALPLVCRVPQSESNYINEPRSSGRPRAPLAPDLQQSLLLGAQQVKDFMVLNAPRQTKYWIGGSALLYHLHFWL